MERLTRPVPLFCNVLAAIPKVDRIRRDWRIMDLIDPPHRLAISAELVEWVWRWNAFTSRKRDSEVGKTKKGQGTGIMVMSEANGLPSSAFTTSAQVAEVNTTEALMACFGTKNGPSS